VTLESTNFEINGKHIFWYHRPISKFRQRFLNKFLGTSRFGWLFSELNLLLAWTAQNCNTWHKQNLVWGWEKREFWTRSSSLWKIVRRQNTWRGCWMKLKNSMV